MWSWPPSYQAELKRYGVELEIRSDTAGFATLRALTDNNSGITAGFVKGGLIGSLQGRLATREGQGQARGVCAAAVAGPAVL